MRCLCLLCLVLLGIAGQAGAGDNLPVEADVRKAVAHSLPFIEKDGLAWIKRRDCMSCHVVTFMLWAHTEAQVHGIAVNAKKLAEWTEWSLDKSLSARVFYKLNDKSFQSLPATIQPKLSALVDEGFGQEKEFTQALAKALTPEELKQHQAALVKQATLPRGAANDGGGLDTLAQLFLVRAIAGKDTKTDFYSGAAKLMVSMQEADGTWKAGGQLPSRRWSRATANQTTTLWTILALTEYSDPNATVKKNIEKAHAAVKKSQGDGNLEWIVARMLYEQKFGTAKQTSAVKEQLLKRQNSDGGWSALPGGKSEAFSTGQSLYGLRTLGLSDNDLIVRRGQKYLLDTQNADGSWTVSPALTSSGGPERLKKLEPIYRNWGTSWASIGLSKSLPRHVERN